MYGIKTILLTAYKYFNFNKYYIFVMLFAFIFLNVKLGNAYAEVYIIPIKIDCNVR